MNDLLLAQDLVAILSSDSYAALRDALRPANNPDGSAPESQLPPNIFAAQDAANTSRPILVIHGEYNNYGITRLGTVTFELRGRIGDQSEENDHQSRFVLLWAALLGSIGASSAETLANQAAAKSALIAAIAALGHITIDDFGPAPQNALVADVDGEDLRTTLSCRIAWRFVSS